MNKYNVRLTKHYNLSVPFMTDWDYELLGDKLRAEFDEYFANEEKLAGAGTGKSKQLLKGEYVKKFMVLKRVNLVDNPVNGNLRSVFIIRKGEPKLIDERAKNSLASRFEYTERKDPTGVVVTTSGFMNFEIVEGVEKKDKSAEETFQVSGDDIQYFNEESAEETPSAEPKAEVQEEEKFACEECGKEFKSKRALTGHNLSHKK